MFMSSFRTPEERRKLRYGFSVFAFVALITLGVFASNGWFPSTDPLSGKRTGWFGVGTRLRHRRFHPALHS